MHGGANRTLTFQEWWKKPLPEGKQFYLFVLCLFGTVAKFCSCILGYQLHHFPYRLDVVSAFVQMLFALLLWRERKNQMWLKDTCKATPVILCNQKQQQLTESLFWKNLERIIPFCICFPICALTQTHHVEEWEQVSLDQSVDVEPAGPPPTEAWLYIKCNAEQLSLNMWL